jgi:hypothetical protein
MAATVDFWRSPKRAAVSLLALLVPAAARKYKYYDYQQLADELHALAKVYRTVYVTGQDICMCGRRHQFRTLSHNAYLVAIQHLRRDYVCCWALPHHFEL